MPLTTDTIEKLDRLLDIFFEKIGRKERIKRKFDKLFEENLAYLKPKVNAWLKQTNKQIISDLNKKFIKKAATPTELVATLTNWEAIEENGKKIFKPAVLNIIAKSGNQSLKIAGVEASFDVVNVKAVAITEKICSTLVREVTDETKKAISKVIKVGIKEGKAMGQVAKEIRPLVGLTTRQTMAVVHYNDWLIENRPDWSLKQINNSVGAYERKLHRRRADLIARTETARAQSEGSLLGYAQGDVKKVEFLTAAGACEICVPLDGRKYTLNEASGVIPAHPGCRCCWAPVIAGVKPKKPEAEIPGFVSAKTIREAERYGERNLIKPGGGHISGVDFGRMSLDNANMVNKRLTGLINDYKIKPNFIGSSQAVRRAVKRTYPSVRFSPVSGRAFAESVPLPNNEAAIAFNEKFFSKSGSALLKQKLENSFASGFHKLKNVEHIIDHEYAHILDYAKKLSVKSDFVKHYTFLKDRSLVKMAISGYADADGLTESWAEIFTLYRADKLPPLRKTLVEGLLK